MERPDRSRAVAVAILVERKRPFNDRVDLLSRSKGATRGDIPETVAHSDFDAGTSLGFRAAVRNPPAQRLWDERGMICCPHCEQDGPLRDGLTNLGRRYRAPTHGADLSDEVQVGGG